MKKVTLLTILLVVAASAAITVEFPDGTPATVGVPVRVVITSDAVDNVDLFVNPGQKPWAYPTEVDLAQTGPTTFEYDDDIEITHPDTNITLYASKGAENDESTPFDVVEGAVAKWLIIAPGETHVPGDATEPDGKTGSASVTAGDDNTYTVNLCDKWYNIAGSAIGYTITITDRFGRVNGNNVELRTAGTQTVTVSGSPYESDVSNVKVNPGPSTQLLIICSGERHEPGDTLTVFQKGGKVEDPIRARAVVGVPYKVNVHVVDDAWNTVTNYPTGDSLRVTGGPAEPLGGFYAVEGGIAKDVEATFVIADADGKDIYAANKAGNLTTEYPTRVFVDEGVLFIEASFDKPMVPSNVKATLTVKAYLDSATTVGAGFPITVERVAGPKEGFWVQNTVTGDSSDTEVTIETISTGEAVAKVWAEAETTYTVRVIAGDKTKDLDLTVKELTELLVAPNPYKYGSPGHDAIHFKYKVEEAGAAEVLLLIADPYGNIAYKATYTSGEVVSPGTQEISWDGTNSKGNRVASGMYQAVVKVTLTNLSTEVLKKNFMVIW